MMGQDQAWVSGQGSNDAVRPRQEFARRFTERIGKLAGNMPGDHRKKTGLVFTQRRSVVDAGVPQEGGLGSGRRLQMATVKMEEEAKEGMVVAEEGVAGAEGNSGVQLW
ncbi:hypothetical protein BHE74_00002617 [Ensete ventricosum]|nr:hypothetical protein BHE74_00002617 [Ensete ventricosum]